MTVLDDSIQGGVHGLESNHPSALHAGYYECIAKPANQVPRGRGRQVSSARELQRRTNRFSHGGGNFSQKT